MTDETKIAYVKDMLGDYDSTYITPSVITTYLDIAENKILNRLYPFGIPEEYAYPYDLDECELAVRLINRRGGEGETAHNENGINRTYGSVGDDDILSRIVPFAKI